MTQSLSSHHVVPRYRAHGCTREAGVGDMHNILITTLAFLLSIIQCTFSHWLACATCDTYAVAIDINTVQAYIIYI